MGLVFFLLPAVDSQAQLYLLNEDFSSASGITPPAGWTNYPQDSGINGTLWQFDNPGNLALGFPISGRAAVFDARQMPSGSSSAAISLESPAIDCSISGNILLFFNQSLFPGNNGRGRLEVYDGESWGLHTEFSSASQGTVQEILNISGFAGSRTGVKIRFTWEGDTTGFWALDNIKILIPSPRDLNLMALDSPKMPFAAGVLPVKVSIFNEGIETINSAVINWNVNGIQQPSFNWTGSLPFGEKVNDIEIGSYIFPPGGIRTFRVWVSNPNNNTDYNRFNDTITSRLGATMCGNYTIGGNNPDFASFSEAAFALNNASISCPVVFKVRPGIYQEQVQLGRISGSSAQNTITFEPENGDSTSVTLQYNLENISRDFTLSLSGTRNTRFNKLNILRQNGQVAVLMADLTRNLVFTGCRTGNINGAQNACDSGIVFSGNSTGKIQVSGSASAYGLVISNNKIKAASLSGGRQRGIFLKDFPRASVSGNSIDVSSIQDVSGISAISSGVEAQNCPELLVSGNSIQCFSRSIIGSRTNQSTGISISGSSGARLESNQLSLYGLSGFALVNGIVVDTVSRQVLCKNNILSLRANGATGYGGTYMEGLNIRSNRAEVSHNSVKTGNVTSASINFAIRFSGDSSLILDNTLSNSKAGIGLEGKENTIRKNNISNVSGTGIDIISGRSNAVLQNRVNRISNGTACRTNSPYTLIANNFIQTDGSGISQGILVDSAAQNADVCFNSVSSSGTDVFNTSALVVKGSSSSKFRNNIFACPVKGPAVTVLNPGNGLVWSNNCYFSPSAFLLSYNGSPAYSLASLVSVLGQNNGSISVNPFFASLTDLSSNHIALNEAGVPVPGINTDILDSARGPAPDIGAREFTPCVFDAGIDRFVGLESPIPSGTRPVKVVLQNHGANPLTSLTIHWSVNGLPQPDLQWTGSLASGTTEVQVGSYTFAPGVPANIIAYTELPGDCNPGNDSTRSGSLASALCGTYRIGGVNPDFDSFEEAFSTLTAAGITCPVVFRVADGNYNEQIQLGEVQGSSLVNTITFESISGDSSKVNLEYSGISTTKDYTLNLRGSDNLIFRNIGIKRQNGNVAILLSDGNHHLEFRSSVIGNVLSAGTQVDSFLTFHGNNAGFIMLNGKQGANSREIKITSNTIFSKLTAYSPHFGVLVSYSTAPEIRNNVISIESKSALSGSSCVAQYACGIGALYSPEAEIKGNIVKASSTFSYGKCPHEVAGLRLGNSPGASVNSNRFTVDSYSSNATSRGAYLDGNNRGFSLDSNLFVLSSTITQVNENKTIDGILNYSSGSGRISGNEIRLPASADPGNTGIHATGDSLDISNNRLSNFKAGIESKSGFSKISHNLINNIQGDGISLISGTNQQVNSNRILNVSGTGLLVQASGAVLFNNFIHVTGNLPARGIWLKTAASGARLYFNSVNAEGTDVLTSFALDLEKGQGSDIKNNIFNNYGSGPALRLNSLSASRSWNYNCYYSKNSSLALIGSLSYPTLVELRNAIGQDAASFNVNPYFVSDTNLSTNQSLLDNSGLGIGLVATDIDGRPRASLPDIGAREFEPCEVDLGINRIQGLQSPLPSGYQPVNVILQNHGTREAESVSIFWEVNGVAQVPFFWSGILPGKSSDTIQIGNFYFLPGRAYVVKAWTSVNDGNQDCNLSNDSSQTGTLVTYLCGVFTIGGSNPDFLSVADAVKALNYTGVSCPVIFKIRNGTYRDQVEIGNVAGSSTINTITFESESKDSSLVKLEYQQTDENRDFTFGVSGTRNLLLRHIGISRKNGKKSLQISGGAGSISISNCKIGNVYSPATSADSAIVMENNRCGSIQLYSPTLNPAGRLTIRGNSIDGTDADGTSGAAVLVSGYSNAQISGNRINAVYNQSNSGNSVSSFGVSLINCTGGEVSGNVVSAKSRSQFVNTENQAFGILLSQSKNIEVSSNQFSAVSSVGIAKSTGCSIEGNCENVVIQNNQFTISSDIISGSSSNVNRGISLVQGTGIRLENNTIVPVTSVGSGKIQYGIYSAGVQSVISLNRISSASVGIETRGINSEIYKNRITGISGTGIAVLAGQGQKVYKNRLFGISNGAAISVQAKDASIANNVIQTIGTGVSKGIQLLHGSDNTKVVFNSVEVQGTDYDLAAALELQESANTVVKNNIFANLSNGNVIQVSALPVLKDWDFNCYYSAGPQLGRLGTTGFSSFEDWRQALAAEVNSKFLQPFFQSDTLLIPSQRQINGAGIPVFGFDTDIEGRVRSSLAPDLGAYEFITDFGLSSLLSPTQACLKTTDEKITVKVDYKGNVPGNNLILACRVNEGNILYDTIYGNFSQNTDFTFTPTIDLSAPGTYRLKLWLVDNQDDNPGNDTVNVIRVSGESPLVEISDSAGCASSPVHFQLQASISSGSLSPVYEWFFGDSDTSVFLPSPASHLYPRSDTFLVTARAFTQDGCYGEGNELVIIKPTPKAEILVSDHCFGSTLPLQNLSVLENDVPVYSWNFGDQTSSSEASPVRVYSSLGDFEVQLIVSAQNSQCADTVKKLVRVNPLPALSTNLDTAYYENEGFIPLTGTPPGGLFFGNGVFGNQLNTDFVGVGSTVVSYTYGIAETGCRDTLSQRVNIREKNLPPVLVFTSPSKSICAGKPVSLLVQATGTRLRFQWFRNGSRLHNDTLPILNFNPAQVSQSGSYRLSVWNQLDTIVTEPIVLIVNPSLSRTDSVVICSGSEYQLPDGQFVSLPGIYVSALISSAGCDSTITTVLDTSSLIRRTFSASICNGSVYSFYGNSLSLPGIYSHTVITGSGCDSLYVLQLSVTIPDTISEEISSCQPVEWYGETYASSGIFFHSVAGAPGECDTTFRLIFVRLAGPDTSVTLATGCGSYAWNGVSYSQSGTYFHTFITPAGCDSVARLDLTVFPRPDTSITSASSCGPFVWNNLLYLISGTYYKVFTLPNGCDSVARLDIVIYQVQDSALVQVSSCGPYSWNNQLLLESGTYYFDTITSGGCDSTVVLQLTVFPKPDTLVQDTTHCGPFIWNGILYSVSGTYTRHFSNSNGCDSVAILHLQVVPASDTSVTVVQHCGSYLWNGVTYTQSGTYFTNFPLEGRCDSVARLDLSVYAVASADTIRSCGPYFWNGITRENSGIYQVTLPNAIGCDSTASLYLTVLPVPDSSQTAAQSCGPYFWNGDTYFNTGIYYFNTVNANGCDSTAVLFLVVATPPNDSLLIDSSCTSYLWNGVEYTASGVYTVVTPLPNGCDSTSILDLTIIPGSSSFTAQACGSYIWNNQVYDSSGTFTQVFTNILGCDSTVTLNLTVFPKPDTSETVVASCGPYFWNGILRLSSGTYYFDTQNASGCDSTAKLLLTLLPQPDTVQVVDSACGSYTWKNQVITESGVYLFITPGPAGGCDTVSRLAITIFPNASLETVTACGEYLWNNQQYTVSGIYTFTSISSKGCDSTATLDLTILSPPETVFLEYTRCLPFLWHNQVFDTAGVYQVVVDLAGPCDSIYILNISAALPPDTSVQSQVSCGPYFWNGLLRDSSGTYFYSVQNQFGCDSVARLDLSILPSVNFIESPLSTGFTEGNTISLSVSSNPAAGQGITLRWQVDQGSGFADISLADPAYQGADSSTLLILNGPAGFDGYIYRCLAFNGSCSDTSGVAVITGERELRNQTLLVLQPNPARNQTRIRLEGQLENAGFLLFDVRGVMVASGPITGKFTSLDISKLSPGIYTLRVQNSRGEQLPPAKLVVE